MSEAMEQKRSDKRRNVSMKVHAIVHNIIELYYNYNSIIQDDKNNKNVKEIVAIPVSLPWMLSFHLFLCFVLLSALYSQKLLLAVTMENKTFQHFLYLPTSLLV